MENSSENPVLYGENKYLFKTWKIILQSNKMWQAVRIRPTYFFPATSLNAAVAKINHLEKVREETGDYPNFNDRKDSLMKHLHEKKKRLESARFATGKTEEQNDSKSKGNK